MTRIGILGIGGVGGYLGAKLAAKYAGSNNVEIVFIARGENQLAIKSNGIKLITPRQEFLASPDIVSNDPKEIGAIDYLICCVKSYHLIEALENINTCIGKGTVILPLLNGVDSRERIEEIFPDNEVWSGCVYILARLSAPGVVTEIGNIHQFHFGSPNGTPNKLKTLDKIFIEASVDSYLSDNIERTIWDKFLLISTIASLTSALDLTIPEIFESRSHTAALHGLMQELIDVGEATGITFSDGVIDKTFKILESSPDGSTSSMHSDFQAGGNTEYKSLTQFVVEKGVSSNVPTPHYEKALAELLKRTEENN